MRIIIDTREQLPYDFGEIPIVNQALGTGDYSIEGLEGQVSIERKSLPDLIASLGQERARFFVEMERLKTYPVRRLLVEVDRISLVEWLYEGAMHPNSVTGTLDALDADGIPVVYASNRATAQGWARSFMVRVHERLTGTPHKAYPALATTKSKVPPRTGASIKKGNEALPKTLQGPTSQILLESSERAGLNLRRPDDIDNL